MYPQFARVPGDSFVTYEADHQRLVSFAVGPLFVLDAAACITAFVVGPRIPSALAAGCLLAILALTALGAVPRHRRLSEGFDGDVHRQLLAVDGARLVLALAAVAAAAWYAV